MSIPSTIRIYLQDDHCFEIEAAIVAIHENRVAFDQTCFHPGGGGQPPDNGTLILKDGTSLAVESAYADEDEVIWHVCEKALGPEHAGEAVRLQLNSERRLSLMRYHTALHVLNTIMLREYGGWITGVQIAEDYSRIDFKLDSFSAAMSPALEEKVNAVLQGDHPLRAYSIPEEEFRLRSDLLRTLEAKPPISRGQVRVVEIGGFDAQACGGTHMHNTNEVGRFSIFRMDNKGKNNKRFYIRLD